MSENEKSRLYLKQIQVGPMANYVYIIGDRDKKKAMLVDPAWEVESLLDELDKEDFELDGVLVTHYHPDHIGGDFMGQHIDGICEVLERHGTKIYINKEESDYVKKQSGLESSDLVSVDGQSSVSVGDIPIRFLHTPGHTPGSQCFLVGDKLVSGDTLFIGACGRVDLPGSNPTDLYYSLTQKLAKLPDSTILFPGHNYAAESSSTIGKEKATNPYMRFAGLQDYLQAMGLA